MEGAHDAGWRKGKPKQNDGSVLAGDLRPITIGSIWWRVICKARFSQNAVQQWLGFLPDYVFGGKPRTGVMDAIAPLMSKADEGWFIGTLDLEKAFDRADPLLACRVLTHFGMPTGQVQLLRQVWTQQIRHMQYLSQTAPQPDLARVSLPQGDSWAMHDRRPAACGFCASESASYLCTGGNGGFSKAHPPCTCARQTPTLC